ncbi:hypothetical protein EAO68_22255 [Streptomyces sp. wa22]|nr:hypothetical protein EAO68_22255 [Streptomyces sp. wa22]
MARRRSCATIRVPAATHACSRPSRPRSPPATPKAAAACNAKPRDNGAPPLSRAETRAVREWARQQGIDVGTSGQIADRVAASWHLHRAGRLDVLGADGLVDERRVRQWARRDGVHLGARGRVTSGAWLAYAAHCLGPDDSDIAAKRQQQVRTTVQESLFELNRPDSSRTRSGPFTL